MKQIDRRTCWSLLVFAIVLSPVALILAVPMAIGFGLDVFDLASEETMVAMLCTPPGLGLLWLLVASKTPWRTIVWLSSRIHLETAAHLIHAR